MHDSFCSSFDVKSFPPPGDTHSRFDTLGWVSDPESRVLPERGEWQVCPVYLVTNGNNVEHSLHAPNQMTKISIYSLTFLLLNYWVSFATWCFNRYKAQGSTHFCCQSLEIHLDYATIFSNWSSFDLSSFIYFVLYTRCNDAESWFHQLWSQTIASVKHVWNITVPRGLILD